MRIRNVLLAAAAALAPAGAACAACVNFSAGNLSLQYDPLGAQADSDLVESISLEAQRQPSSPLASAVIGQFVDRHGQVLFKLAGDGPLFTIATNQGLTVIVGDAAAPLQPFHYFGAGFPGSPSTVTRAITGLQFVVPRGQDVPAGTYQENIDVQFSCLVGGNDDSHQQADVITQTAVLPVTITVPNKISANLAGGQTHGVIDFGDFDQLLRRVAIDVRSTGPYDLLITSQNSGKMLLGDIPKAAGATSTSIAYSLQYGGFPVTLGTPGLFQRTGALGANLDLVVTAEPVTSKRAGEYRDTLTVTFTPASI